MKYALGFTACYLVMHLVYSQYINDKALLSFVSYSHKLGCMRAAKKYANSDEAIKYCEDETSAYRREINLLFKVVI